MQKLDERGEEKERRKEGKKRYFFFKLNWKLKKLVTSAFCMVKNFALETQQDISRPMKHHSIILTRQSFVRQIKSFD